MNDTRHSGQGAVVFALVPRDADIRPCASLGRRKGILVAGGIQADAWRAFAWIRSGGSGSGFSWHRQAKLSGSLDDCISKLDITDCRNTGRAH